NLGPDDEVSGLSPGEKRHVIIEHPQRRLAKALIVSAADSKGPLDVKAEPYAAVTARLLLDGDPAAGAIVRFSYLIGDNFIHQFQSISDKDGRFTNDEIPPGVELTISCELKRQSGGSKEIAKKLATHGGETIDFGEIDLAKDERPEPKRTAVAKATGAT